MNNIFKNKLILVVDDEDDIRDLLSYHLTKCGFKVITANNGKNALKCLYPLPDLMLVDIMMPEMNGLELCKTIRTDSETKNIPIIFLSARDSEIDEIYGLDSGADDYLIKPISLKILESRIQAILRRTITNLNILDFGLLKILLDEYIIKLKDKKIKLTRIEFDILTLLAKNTSIITYRKYISNLIKA